MSWQNRIISYGTKPANQFMANPLNWRTHPNVQREALRNLKRTCYAMEISPAYVAVCLERMTTAFPHLKIEKEEAVNGKAA